MIRALRARSLLRALVLSYGGAVVRFRCPALSPLFQPVRRLRSAVCGLRSVVSGQEFQPVRLLLPSAPSSSII